MSSNSTPDPVDVVDVRGPRFVAWVTTAVLIAALVAAAINTTAAAIILGLQATVFAIGACRGPREQPYGRIFAAAIANRLGPATEREPVPPLKFAQLVGCIFTIIGTAGFSFGVPALGLVATAFALFAAFLNAAFGICLGCGIYPFVVRLRRMPATT